MKLLIGGKDDRNQSKQASSEIENIPCRPTNITTLVFPFFGVKEGFPVSNILQSSLKIAWKKINILTIVVEKKTLQNRKNNQESDGTVISHRKKKV